MSTDPNHTSRCKQEIRQRIWDAMEAAKVTRFPGAQGRIPNFKGASKAAERVVKLGVWETARVLKCNPDSAQRYVRLRALEAGKLVYMAIPRLRDRRCFLEIDPCKIAGSLEYASSIRGAFSVGRKVTLGELSTVDLIICGSVGVSKDGARLGKGGGFSDLEYALAVQKEVVSPETPILTTVHALQVVNDDIPMLVHDIPVDYIVTPDETIEPIRRIRRPERVYWELLPPEKVEEVPVLKHLRCS